MLDKPEVLFDRQARQFWGIVDTDLAARVHALVGGTPYYLDYADGQHRQMRRASTTGWCSTC